MLSLRLGRRSNACTSSRSRTGIGRSARPWEHCAEARVCESGAYMALPMLPEISISCHEPSRHVHNDFFVLLWADRLGAHVRDGYALTHFRRSWLHLFFSAGYSMERLARMTATSSIP